MTAGPAGKVRDAAVAILAGGRGERLRPLTDGIPKPMVPIRGKPYLEYQLERLAAQGWRRIVLLTGYLGDAIERRLGDGARFGLSIEYSREPSPLGTGGALRLARDRLTDPFLLIYGDSLLPVDYAPILAHLAGGPWEVVIAVYRNRGDIDAPDNVGADPDGRVRIYRKEAAREDLNRVEAGVSAFRLRALDRLPGEGPSSLEGDLFPSLAAEGRLGAWESPSRFYDIGTRARIEEIAEFLR
ncbi:MAG: NTP transferase domain-containing protein [Planctomycetes bacterium]|nr:NTP transferase domain-containing protein [Planctomycetota bacterium]